MILLKRRISWIQLIHKKKKKRLKGVLEKDHYGYFKRCKKVPKAFQERKKKWESLQSRLLCHEQEMAHIHCKLSIFLQLQIFWVQCIYSIYQFQESFCSFKFQSLTIYELVTSRQILVLIHKFCDTHLTIPLTKVWRYFKKALNNSSASDCKLSPHVQFSPFFFWWKPINRLCKFVLWLLLSFKNK